MNNVEVLVDLPFILLLKDFAMVSIKPLTSLDEDRKKTDSEAVEFEDVGALPSPASPTKSEPFSPDPRSEKATPENRITIAAKVKKPLIALVEDAEDVNSRALVLCVSHSNLPL